MSGWLGRGGEPLEVTLLFTELRGFEAWMLKAGDERALELHREVATVVEPCISAHEGRVVKRLGHGHMAVFRQARDGLAAALGMQATLADRPVIATVDGREADARPRLGAGLHCGSPRRLGGDYLGADVNIAARISAAAKAGEVLVSGEVLASIEPEQHDRLDIRRRRAFRAKGAPPELEVYCVTSSRQG